MKCSKECENCIFHSYDETECNFTECIKMEDDNPYDQVSLKQIEE